MRGGCVERCPFIGGGNGLLELSQFGLGIWRWVAGKLFAEELEQERLVGLHLARLQGLGYAIGELVDPSSKVHRQLGRRRSGLAESIHQASQRGVRVLREDLLNLDRGVALSGELPAGLGAHPRLDALGTLGALDGQSALAKVSRG